ncbi:hypothetical protein ACUXV3_16555 [Roseobacteraceae bacterium NS-SX3]
MILEKFRNLLILAGFVIWPFGVFNSVRKRNERSVPVAFEFLLYTTGVMISAQVVFTSRVTSIFGDDCSLDESGALGQLASEFSIHLAMIASALGTVPLVFGSGRALGSQKGDLKSTLTVALLFVSGSAIYSSIQLLLAYETIGNLSEFASFLAYICDPEATNSMELTYEQYLELETLLAQQDFAVMIFGSFFLLLQYAVLSFWLLQLFKSNAMHAVATAFSAFIFGALLLAFTVPIQRLGDHISDEIFNLVTALIG